jgi:hypothetical protein
MPVSAACVSAIRATLSAYQPNAESRSVTALSAPRITPSAASPK